MSTFFDTFTHNFVIAENNAQTNKNTDIDDIDNYFRYDSKSDIEKCLSCTKSECTNCLRYRNGV